VTFRVLNDREIREYAASGEPLDKAGGYAYQGHAEKLVTRLEGEVDTVHRTADPAAETTFGGLLGVHRRDVR